MRSVPARLAAFAAVLLVAFGLAFGVGRATAIDDGDGSPARDADHGGGDQMGEMDEMTDMEMSDMEDEG